jgi:hypothetical protein
MPTLYFPTFEPYWIFNHRKIMTDLIFIGVIVLFFVVGGLYVRACEKM